MKFIGKKKIVKKEDPVNLINDCIISLDEIKKKIYHQNDTIKMEYYTADELDEYVNWYSNFRLKDFIR